MLFVRLLREVGIPSSPEQVSDFGRILERIGITGREDFYFSARAIFVRRREDLALFERAFNLFFQIQGNPQQSVIDPTQAPVARRSCPVQIQQLAEDARRRENSGDEETASDIETTLTYSAVETLREKRFDKFTPEEQREARRLMDELDWQPGMRRTRRYRHSPHGASLDLMRAFRRNIKHGAELFDLPARTRKYKPRPLVVIADLSGSMDAYSRMVLYLLHALSHAELAPRVEVFGFGTRLTRLTPDMKRKSVDAALERVSRRAQDWSGGTRIGDALKTFNFKWARRVLRHGAVVLIISDGWDRGDLDLLRTEMARLQKSCARLIWLNPLLGDATFRAEQQGLQVALPFVDEHLPVHNLASLESLIAALASIGDARPLRRQLPRVEIPREEKNGQKFMELPQMGESDYVRRTMTLRVVNGLPSVRYEENPSD